MEISDKITKDGLTKQAQLSQESLSDFGNFEFWNGDRYEGQYLANKQQFSIVRDGQGTYWTNQSVYNGNWKKDVIEEADEIIFPDKSVFTGSLKNMTLEGPGIYKFKHGIEIQGHLRNNHFIGVVELKDPNGHYWKAFNNTNEDEIIFYPVQPFWQAVLNISNFVLPYNDPEENENETENEENEESEENED